MLRYALVSIIYLGQCHFTCRLFDQMGVWKYDGQLHGGQCILEHDCFADIDLLMDSFRSFDGKVLHNILYVKL